MQLASSGMMGAPGVSQGSSGAIAAPVLPTAPVLLPPALPGTPPDAVTVGVSQLRSMASMGRMGSGQMGRSLSPSSDALAPPLRSAPVVPLAG